MELENSLLDSKVEADSKLKELVVNYIGEKLSPEDKSISVEMALEVFAEEFPEFVLALAEENFIRGYQQAMNDVYSMMEKQKENEEPAA
jgi:hypothetical protein